MTKVVKLQIIKPINQDWKVFGDILYNLKNDPGETMNLQATNNEVLEEFKSILIKLIVSGRSS